MGEQRGLPRFAALPVGIVAAVQAAVLTALSGRYGFHRDELYFVASGRRPDWGYVDNPPITPWLARASTAVFGETPAGLRVVATLLGVATVVVVALLAREFGGGRGVQLFSAIATALSTYVLVVSHMLATNSADLLLWSLITLFGLKLLRTGDGRWWLAAGAAAGVGLANKWLVLLLLSGLGIGVAVAGPRRVFRTRWLAAGIGIAVVLAAPVVAWQAAHDWPMLTVAGGISADDGGENRALFVPMQLVLLSPVLVPVWVAGLVRPWRDPGLRWARALTIAYPVVCLELLAVGGKPYYSIPLLLPLVALGAEPVLRWLGRGRPTRRALTGAATAVCVVVSVLIGLPVVPPPALNGVLLAMNKEPGEQVGWPEFAGSVAAAWQRIPAPERDTAVIVAGNYGEAGAIERYGPELGLPQPYSPHMSYADWGPPPDRLVGPVLLVGGFERGSPAARLITGCRPVAKHFTAGGVDNDENGVVLSLCTLTKPWSVAWPRLRQFY
ncbi:glycosyltransferase family 39 protein [Amycolatopsis sp. SID8362]|uniref:glycosyltransferase family 39 protein n=1 Tax=Amycolatopsis sp. SID8362 TaxID=2690346 RepID=UPI00136F3CF6|nr:glycosyltransferase family 39 protein [Amycolatopsis sp. SID8362]NBH12512.1 phospholipid carrier-dependent glycosyltransferase [Amycolatopsis sp. SID8362]NED49204.1 glycosyltransferase family 39 protein [Amycolatopsis sp. SID8362]